MKSVSWRLRLAAFIGACALTFGCANADTPQVSSIHADGSCAAPSVQISDDPHVVAVAGAAKAWLDSLDENLKERVRFCLGDEEMHSWTNVPGTRTGGIEFRDMNREQQDLAWELLRLFMSEEGYTKANLIATEITQTARAVPLGSHSLVLFGDPAHDGAWGFQVDGHHLALNFLVQSSDVILAPAFLGAQPLSANGRSPLGDEANLGRLLIATLMESERVAAKQDSLIGRDVVVGSGRGHVDRGLQYDVTAFDGIGMPIADLGESSRMVVDDLILEYLNNLAPPFANRVLDLVDASAAHGYVVFDERDSDIYYRIYIPQRLLIEYNDVRHDHVHTIVRLLGDDGFSDYGEYAQGTSAPLTLANHYLSAAHHRSTNSSSQVDQLKGSLPH